MNRKVFTRTFVTVGVKDTYEYPEFIHQPGAVRLSKTVQVVPSSEPASAHESGALS